MAKTRSQTRSITIKKEEEEDCKSTLGLGIVRNTRSSGKIAKGKSSIINNRGLPAQRIKVEEDTDTKSLLKSAPNSSKLPKGQCISQEQINQLFGYIMNDKMSATAAARKVKICHHTGLCYYNIYKNDPEKKIPLARIRWMLPKKYYTQEQIRNLIKYINDDKMTIKEASAKADMLYSSAHQYYNRYLKDPKHNTPILQLQQSYTQDQKNEFIAYIVRDKMSITAASKKAKIKEHTGQKYYRNYFKAQNPDIARPSHITTPKCYTQEHIKEVISYIVDGKMSIRAASIKANVCDFSARRFYRQYLIDNNMEIPVSKMGKRCTQDQINELLRCIFDDKMTVKAASKKANMHEETAGRYYRQYLEDHNLDAPNYRCATQDQINELIGYIVDDKMSVTAASKKVKISHTTGRKYYRQYLNNQMHDTPTRCPRVASARKNN